MITLRQITDGTPYAAYAYSYPHKTAYRPLTPPRPLAEAWAGEAKDALFLYLHVPFCEMRCGFCNLFTAANPREEIAEHGVIFRLDPGEAIYVPVMAPHYVKNGPRPSISLSITWRSEWSFAEADARAFNALLRRWGFDPRPPGRWPARNSVKAIAWRALRRVPGIR